MASNGDILQLTLKGYYSTVATAVMNVFQYKLGVSGTLDLALDGQAFIDGYADAIREFLEPILSVEVAYPRMDIVNLSEPLEIWTGSFTNPINGAVTGEVAPPFITWSFLLQRTNASTRNGQKRFSGVPETQMVNGIPTAAAALLLQDMSGFLGLPFVSDVIGGTPATVILEPTIVRKDETGALIASQPVLNARFTAIGSQNTRKFGRGI